jgi:hypothetical protein
VEIMNPSTRIRRLLVGSVSVSAIIAAGCGSSSALNQSTLAAKVNAICASTNAKAGTVRSPSANSVSDYVPYLRTLTAITRSERDQIKALNPAAGLKPDVQTYLSSESRVLALEERGYASALNRNLSGVTSAQDAEAGPSSALRAAAQRLGWSECAK